MSAPSAASPCVGNVVATIAGIFSDRVEGAEVPTSVTLHRCQLPVDIGALWFAAEVGPIAAERLVDQQRPDRHVFTVDRCGAGGRDSDVGDVVDIGVGLVDVDVLEADVEPSDLVERRRGVGDARAA